MKQCFCPNCCQNVTMVPQYNITALVLLLLCGIIPGLIYWALRRDRMCPICRTTGTSISDGMAMQSM